MPYNDLPRVEINEVDRSQYVTTTGTGPILLVIGPSDKGPVGVPTTLTSISDLITQFGLPTTEAALSAYFYLDKAGQNVVFVRSFPPDFSDADSDTDGDFYKPKDIITPAIADVSTATNIPSATPVDIATSFTSLFNGWIQSLSTQNDAFDKAVVKADFLQYLEDDSDNKWTTATASAGPAAPPALPNDSYGKFSVTGLDFKYDERGTFNYVGKPGESLRAYVMFDMDDVLDKWGVTPVAADFAQVGTSGDHDRVLSQTVINGYLYVVADDYDILSSELQTIWNLATLAGRGLYTTYDGISAPVYRANYKKAYNSLLTNSDSLYEFQIWRIPLKIVVSALGESIYITTTQYATAHYAFNAYIDPDEFTSSSTGDYGDLPFEFIGCGATEYTWLNGSTRMVANGEMSLRFDDSGALAINTTTKKPTSIAGTWDSCGADRVFFHGLYLNSEMDAAFRSVVWTDGAGKNPGDDTAGTLDWDPNGYISEIVDTASTYLFDTSVANLWPNLFEIMALFSVGNEDEIWTDYLGAVYEDTDTLIYKMMYYPRYNLYERVPALQKLYDAEGCITTQHWGLSYSLIPAMLQTRVLVLVSGGYVNCVPTDIGKPVVGGTTAHTGTLRWYDNTTRTWHVSCSPTNTFPSAEALSITGGGAGAGTTTGASTTNDEIYTLFVNRGATDTNPQKVVVGVLNELVTSTSELADNTATDFWLSLIPGTGLDGQVYSKMLDLLTWREKDFIFLPELDVSTGTDPVADIISDVSPLPESDCIAYYFPGVGVVNPIDGSETFMPGALAAAIQAGLLEKIWQSPAGNPRGVLGWVTRAELRVSKSKADLLYTQANINPIIRPKRYASLTIWGGRTSFKKGTSVKSALSSINVRLLLLYVKRKFRDILWDFPFDINDPALYTTFTGLFGPFLDGLIAAGALSAYELVNETTADDVNNAKFKVGVHLTPAREAEIIIGTIYIYKQGASFLI